MAKKERRACVYTQLEMRGTESYDALYRLQTGGANANKRYRDRSVVRVNRR